MNFGFFRKENMAAVFLETLVVFSVAQPVTLNFLEHHLILTSVSSLRVLKPSEWQCSKPTSLSKVFQLITLLYMVLTST
jgi:hypothetical protein